MQDLPYPPSALAASAAAPCITRVAELSPPESEGEETPPPPWRGERVHNMTREARMAEWPGVGRIAARQDFILLAAIL